MALQQASQKSPVFPSQCVLLLLSINHVCSVGWTVLLLLHHTDHLLCRFHEETALDWQLLSLISRLCPHPQATNSQHEGVFIAAKNQISNTKLNFTVKVKITVHIKTSASHAPATKHPCGAWRRHLAGDARGPARKVCANRESKKQTHVNTCMSARRIKQRWQGRRQNRVLRHVNLGRSAATC